jgi:glutathione peroxidase
MKKSSMKPFLALLCLSQVSCSMYSGEDAKKIEMTPSQNFHSFQVSALEGQPVNLADYKGKVVLVVNVASECGYTQQYAGLEALHKELAPRGFAVMGFPSNEFGGQEPGSMEQIRTFCSSKFGVTFPMFGKLETKPGANQSPLYAWLGGATGKLPGWNFSKYLIAKDGQAIAFYPSGVAPESAELRTAIEAALK